MEARAGAARSVGSQLLACGLDAEKKAVGKATARLKCAAEAGDVYEQAGGNKEDFALVARRIPQKESASAMQACVDVALPDWQASSKAGKSKAKKDCQACSSPPLVVRSSPPSP